MAISLLESGFFSGKAKFMPLSAFLLYSFYEDKGIKHSLQLTEEQCNFYSQLKKGISSDKGSGIKEEEIRNFFGVFYCDDGSIRDDIKHKKSLNNFVWLLKNNVHLKKENDATKSALVHIFNEIDRNIRNHSGFRDFENKTYRYSILVYPNVRKLQFVFIDEGVGIHETLCQYENPVLEAVKMGVSARSNHKYANGDGKNSGYGLYMLNELGKKNHILEIIDNHKYYVSNKDGIKEKLKATNSSCKITLVSFVCDIRTIANDLSLLDTNIESKSSKSNLNTLKFNDL